MTVYGLGRCLVLCFRRSELFKDFLQCRSPDRLREKFCDSVNFWRHDIATID